MPLCRRNAATLSLCAACLLGACAQEAANGRKWVHAVAIEGNARFSDGQIEEKLATRATPWWPLAARRWFDQDAFDIDLDRVKAFYAAHGYFDARVTASQIRDRGDGSVDVVIRVDEGQPTRIEEIELAGLGDLHPAHGAKVGKLPIHAGEVFDHGEYMSAKDNLLRELEEGGYAYAKVSGKVLVDRDQRTARIRLSADPGPLVKLGKAIFEGEGPIPEHTLEHRVTWSPGEIYRPEDLKLTQGRLYDLGVFSSVQTDLPREPTSPADVTIKLAVGKLHELRLGGGVGAERQWNEVRLRFEWNWRNFLGGLRTLRLRVRPAYVVAPSVFDVKRSGPAAIAELELTQPDILHTNVTAHGLGAYDLGVAYGYDYHGPRAQLGVDRPFWHERVLAGISWNLQYLTFFDIDPAVFNLVTSPFGFAFANPYRLAWLEEFGQLDLRDHPLSPRRGAYFAVRSEQGTAAVGGSFDYFKLTPELRAYLPLGRRFVLAWRGELGWLAPVQGADSPITRRYALGGPASHRGFGFGRLAPQVANPMTGERIPVGGDGELLLSAEARIDVTRIRGDWFGVDLFVDAGDVTPTFADLDPWNLHVAVGTDLGYHTVVGQVRAGIGVRLNRTGLMDPDPNDRWAFHLTIGEAF